MAAPVPAAQDVAGYGHDLTTLFERISSGDERPRLLRGLDHDDAEREPADQAIPSGKWCGNGGVPGGYSLTTSPASAICAASGSCSGG